MVKASGFDEYLRVLDTRRLQVRALRRSIKLLLLLSTFCFTKLTVMFMINLLLILIHTSNTKAFVIVFAFAFAIISFADFSCAGLT